VRALTDLSFFIPTGALWALGVIFQARL
jgi:hypothetical protein